MLAFQLYYFCSVLMALIVITALAIDQISQFVFLQHDVNNKSFNDKKVNSLDLYLYYFEK